MWDFDHSLLPSHLQKLFKYSSEIHSYDTRSSANANLARNFSCNTQVRSLMLKFMGPKVINSMKNLSFIIFVTPNILLYQSTKLICLIILSFLMTTLSYHSVIPLSHQQSYHIISYHLHLILIDHVIFPLLNAYFLLWFKMLNTVFALVQNAYTLFLFSYFICFCHIFFVQFR